MKLRITVAALFIALLFTACGNNGGIPRKYRPLLEDALNRAGENRAEMERALNEAPRSQKEGMAYLISYMPQGDLDTLTADFLLKNVEYAYLARNRFIWTKEVPMKRFLNDVLPYANAGETRDDWREDFYNRFTPYVENCKTLEEAVYAINQNAHNELKVEYSTARRRADQSPNESLEISIASCTGLSILLTDAFRAVGIPSRLAGTIWHDNRGNHTWSEVWMNGKWHFTEYYYPGQLDNAWFLADAGKSTPEDPRHAIVAASFGPTGLQMPQAWNRQAGRANCEDVSQRYIDIYNTVRSAMLADTNYVSLKVRMFADESSATQSEGRVQVNVDIFQEDNQLGGGSTAGPTQDMNDVLEFLVERNKEYILKYFPEGQSRVDTVAVLDEPVEVTLFVRK